MDKRHSGKWIVVVLLTVTSCLCADDCSSSLPCLHGGTCVEVEGSAECMCTENFVGQRCEAAIRHCLYNDPCLNGAVCEDIHDGGFQCYCRPGYYGNLCQYDINECASSPCHNGGTCMDNLNGYTCSCPIGYAGSHCETADSRVCASSPCLHGSTCVTMTTSGRYTCTCSDGYTGQWCELDIDDCEGHTCESYQVCADLVAGYRCDCPEGKTGNQCEITIDGCVSSPCLNQATCIHEWDRFTCHCTWGYRGIYCEVQVDPCFPYPCLNGATCQTDLSTDAGYICQCSLGFVGDKCQGKTLQCDSWISSSDSPNISGPCYNGGSCHENLYEPGFTCMCTNEYTGNQCETQLEGCLLTSCEYGGTCVDTGQGHICQCVSGWTGQFCTEDIDECDSQSCEHLGTCVNLPGTFLCLCDKHWTGVSCHIDVTECDKSPCGNGGTCVENIGAPPDCICPEGTTGPFCEDVLDTCGSQPCFNNGTCVQHTKLEAGYQCICPPGVTGVNCKVQLEGPCVLGPCMNGASCIQDGTGYKCLCLPQFTGTNCSKPLDPCASSPCLYNGTCSVANNATFLCQCLPSFPGNRCEFVTIAMFDGFSLVDFPPLTTNHKRKKRYAKNSTRVAKYGVISGTKLVDKDIAEDAVNEKPTWTVFEQNNHLSQPASNMRVRREAGAEITVSLTFKTTVIDGVLLLAHGKSPTTGQESHLLLQLYHGSMYISQDLTGSTVATEIPLSDDTTHDVIITMTTSHTNISFAGCSEGVANVCHVTLKPDLIGQNINLNTGLWLGGASHMTPYLRSKLKKIEGFTGCIGNLSINGVPISMLPDNQTNPLIDQSALPIPGCRSHDLCDDSMKCENGGRCVDLWNRTYCSCEDGYAGSQCEVQTTAQFSRASFLHLGSMISVVDMQFDISVNATSGTLLYTIDGDPFSLYLSEGQLVLHLVTNGNSDGVITTAGYLATGDWFHVHVIFAQGVYKIIILQGKNVTGSWQGIVGEGVNIRSPIFLGMLHEHPTLDFWREKIGSFGYTSFTGCIQNLTINNMTLDLSTATESIFSNDPPPPIPGCNRDRKCSLSPCQHGGRCLGGWSEYLCACPDSFTGTDCQLAQSASFNGQTSYLEMSVNMRSVPFGDAGSFAFRTRDQTATLVLLQFYAPDLGKPETSLEFSLYRGSLQITLMTPTQTGNRLIFTDTIADANWHTVSWIRGHDLFTVNQGSRSLSLTSQFDPYRQRETVNIYVGAKPFQKSRPSLMVGHMTGCITNLTFNNNIIPILDDEIVSGITINRLDVMPGCHGNDVCVTEGCYGNADCEDIWNAKICTCQEGWRGSFCNESVDDCVDHLCIHGNCIDGHMNYTCSCELGYTDEYCDTAYNPCESGVCAVNGTANCVFIFPGDFECICNQGWTGFHCEAGINECESSPCIHGECRDTLNGYTCDCTGNYIGRRCDQTQICATVLCYNGGTCLGNDNNTDFTCQCLEQFSGKQCQIFNFCSDNICRNNASCISSSLGYSCVCLSEYYGEYCQYTDFCAGNPCLNGGMCENDENSYQCQCGQLYTGNSCETLIDRCDSDNNLCKNGATCLFNTTAGTSFTCVCVEGFTGEFCETDIHECESNPCQNEATCIDSHVTPWRFFPGFHCECLSGYHGDLCEVEISECESSPCKNNGSCVDLINAFQCQCHDGFEGQTCELDRRLCSSNPCRNEAQCVENGEDSYSCVCRVGYTGKLCLTNIDDCLYDECANGASCVDGMNSYTCTCLPGYSGKFCNIVVDACYSQPCEHGGLCHYQGLCSCEEIVTTCGWHNETCQSTLCQQTENCVLNALPYICECDGTGYTGVTCEQDVNECVEMALACEHGGVCSNTLGEYSCNCKGTGYTGARCDLDIDECAGPNPCFNGGQCENFSGAYSCRCPAGWTGVTCGQLVNHCTEISCAHGGMCINTKAGYVCDCTNTGYQGLNCEVNINDCVGNPCLNFGHCIDGVNAFTCNCSDTGFHGDRCQTEIDDCVGAPCQNKATCTDIGLGFECACIEGFTGKRCHIDVNECLINTHQCRQGSTCVNIAGSYSCDCPPSYTGMFCETAIPLNQDDSSSSSSTGVIIACVLILLVILIIVAVYAFWYLHLSRRTHGRYKPAMMERSLPNVTAGIPLDKLFLPGQQERLV